LCESIRESVHNILRLTLPSARSRPHCLEHAFMRYPPDLLDEIRSRLPVSRVVERRVKLKRAGREYIGLSPFKTERTPSFTVNDHKGFYHCFASGEHGDIFKFLMKTEGLSFHETVERLAAEAGVPLPAPAAADEVKASADARLLSACDEACRYFQAQLSGRDGAAARAYLERRGVTSSEVNIFRLGFAPDSKSGLKQHLSQKGFSLDELQGAGLLIHGDGVAVPYDRFRGRLIFPIMNAKRSVVAFGGRALATSQQPKYLNSPETALFHKGHVLFNLAAAREASRATKSVIVAEGYMDVIALSRAGFPNTVAPLGTALTSDQLRLLWTMAPIPTLCFDGDAAGRKAAERALDGALSYLEPGRSLQFVFLPDGSDPDDMVRNGGQERLAKLLAEPLPLIDVLWSREQARHLLETPEQRASLEARLTELAGQIAHRSLKYHYITALREKLRAAAKTHRRTGAGAASGSARRFTGGAAYNGKSTIADVSERTGSLLASKIVQISDPCGALRDALLLGPLLRHPWLLDIFLEEIAGLHLDDTDCERLRDKILSVHHDEEPLDNKKLLEHLCREGYGAELERVERATVHNADMRFAQNASKEQVLEGWRHVMMQHGKAGVPRSLQEAESEYLSEPTAENFSKLSKLRVIVQQAEIVAS
jgi:DNA primase